MSTDNYENGQVEDKSSIRFNKFRPLITEYNMQIKRKTSSNKCNKSKNS